MNFVRHGAWLAVLLVGGCGLVAPTPTPTPPIPSFEILVDIGIFGGPPDLPPEYVVTDLTEDSLLLMVDRGVTQHLREVRWNGERWESLAGMDERLIPAGEDGPYLRTLAIGTDDGFSTDAILLVGRVPNGPINRFEIEVDGAMAEVWVHQRPASLHVFPAGTELGTEFTAFDVGTHELDRGPVHHE